MKRIAIVGAAAVIAAIGVLIAFVVPYGGSRPVGWARRETEP